MRPISEVLRLAAQGRSRREISISTGLAKTSVHRYLERAQQAGLSWPLPADLDETELAALGVHKSVSCGLSQPAEPLKTVASAGSLPRRPHR